MKTQALLTVQNIQKKLNIFKEEFNSAFSEKFSGK
jgi:hypothetical protein